MTRATWLFTLLLAAVLAACSAGGPAASTPGAGSSASPPASEPPTASPDEPIGGVPGDPGGGGGGIDPNPGQPKFVEPQPGVLDPHPVQLEEITVRVEGRHAVLNVTWWSGIEPCSVLESAAWSLDAATNTISVTVREGHGPGDQVCIDIAVQKVTAIDLGELEPGIYTVTAADGGAPDISFTVE